MRSTVLLICVVLLAVCLAGCATKPEIKQESLPEIDAARKALQQADSEGASALCSTEFEAAKDKLRQAELFLEDGQVEAARSTALHASDLADVARKCAIARKSPVPSAPPPSAKPHLGPGADFVNMKHSVYFDFNSNVLTADERARLDPIVEKIKAQAKNFKFFIVLAAYCDAPGNADDNLELARRRARVVAYYLTRPETGIDRDRVVFAAYGNGPATQEEGRSGANREWRRVDILISETLPDSVMQNLGD